MDTDPHRHLDRAARPPRFVVSRDGTADCLGRAHRPQPVVGRRLRCAPKSHDAVADKLVDRATLGLDTARQQLEMVVQQRRDLARPHTLRHRAEAANGGEHHRHLALLRLHRSAIGLANQAHDQGFRHIDLKPA